MKRTKGTIGIDSLNQQRTRWILVDNENSNKLIVLAQCGKKTHRKPITQETQRRKCCSTRQCRQARQMDYSLSTCWVHFFSDRKPTQRKTRNNRPNGYEKPWITHRLRPQTLSGNDFRKAKISYDRLRRVMSYKRLRLVMSCLRQRWGFLGDHIITFGGAEFITFSIAKLITLNS